MQRLRDRRNGILVLAGFLALWISTVFIALAIGGTLEWDILGALLFLGLIAALLVDRRPDNRVSWVMAALALIGAFAGVSASLDSAAVNPTLRVLMGGLGGLAWYSFLYLTSGVLPLIFPTGRPPSPRWRWLLPLGFGAIAGIQILWMVQEQGPCIQESPESEVCLEYLPNPVGIAGIENPEQSTIGGVLFALLLVTVFGALASVVVRFRRARGVERQQLKLLALWAVTAAGSFLWDFLRDIVGWSDPPWYNVLGGLTWLLLPVAIAVAILRYRLYEIDRVISRTVGYTLVVALLAALYGLVVVGVPTVVPGVEDSQLLVAGATLAAFFLFNPLRRRVLRFVDRRFNRSRYDAQRVVEEFSARLRDRVDLEGLTADWVGVVQETVQPSSVSVWMREL